MKVQELMSKKLFTVGPEDMLDKVFFLFNFEAIRHLPVVDKGKGVWMLTSTDILRAYVKLAHEVDKMFKNLDR